MPNGHLWWMSSTNCCIRAIDRCRHGVQAALFGPPLLNRVARLAKIEKTLAPVGRRCVEKQAVQ